MFLTKKKKKGAVSLYWRLTLSILKANFATQVLLTLPAFKSANSTRCNRQHLIIKQDFCLDSSFFFLFCALLLLLRSTFFILFPFVKSFLRYLQACDIAHNVHAYGCGTAMRNKYRLSSSKISDIDSNLFLVLAKSLILRCVTCVQCFFAV